MPHIYHPTLSLKGLKCHCAVLALEYLGSKGVMHRDLKVRQSRVTIHTIHILVSPSALTTKQSLILLKAQRDGMH